MTTNATTPTKTSANNRLTGRRLLFTLLAGLFIAFALPLPAASAHTDLLQGSPGPAQQVGGTVDFVDLAFVDSVSNATITIQDPNGADVGGETVVSDGVILRYEMPALTIPGRYILRFSLISADGDFTESGYFFTYDPAAVEPLRLGEADLPNNSGTIVTIVASIVFGLCLIGLVMVFLAKIERDRASAAARAEQPH